jgi:hypothetical protein
MPNTPHYLSLIEKDQLDEVLNLLKENEAEPVATRASALKARIKELNGHINSGFISLADAGIERNKIRAAIMNLVLNPESSDNVAGDKIVFGSPRFFKRLLLSIITVLGVLGLIGLAFRENIREMLIMETLDDISYYVTNYQYYRSSSSYSQIQEKNNLLSQIKGEYAFNPDQNAIIANSLSTVGNYRGALSYFRDAYEGYKQKETLPNSVTYLAAYCYCSVLAGSGPDKPLGEFPVLKEKFSGEINSPYFAWLEGDLALCRAVEASQNKDMDQTLAFLEEYHLHFQPTSFVYIKTIEHNLDYANNPDARMTGILEKLYLKYQNEIKNYTY